MSGPRAIVHSLRLAVKGTLKDPNPREPHIIFYDEQARMVKCVQWTRMIGKPDSPNGPSAGVEAGQQNYISDTTSTYELYELLLRESLP